MRHLQTVAATAALCALTACTSYDPARMELAAGATDKAVLLLEVKPVTRANYQFVVIRYDEPNHTVLNNSFSGFASFNVKPGDRYLAQTVPAGTYVVEEVAQQWNWVACMHANSLAFDVKPGEVLFLGRLDARPQLSFLQGESLRHGQTVSVQNGIYFYLDDVPPLAIGFQGGREAQLDVIQQYVKTSMPKVSAPVRLAEYRAAHFGTGYSLFGGRVCTGYFKDKPKD